VQAVQPTNTRRRLTIGPPPQLEKPAQPRKVFADRLLCRSFTFLQGGSGECRVTAGVPWFDSFWHSESIVTVLPPTRQVCGLPIVLPGASEPDPRQAHRNSLGLMAQPSGQGSRLSATGGARQQVRGVSNMTDEQKGAAAERMARCPQTLMLWPGSLFQERMG
jgi:hypothetical protein